MQADHLSEVHFESLPLNEGLQRAIAAQGFSRCTPIQAQTLPLALEGRDLAGQAQTGTGKTAAFLLATMHRLLTEAPKGPVGQPRAFILAPTRELAIQIYEDAVKLKGDTQLRLAVCYGGAGYESQRLAIEAGVDILIGTPGRLIDYFKQDVYTLKHVEVVVLDEADRMFDLGFIADIRYLFRRMPEPKARRNYLFSATLSHRVLELAFEHMNDPERVTIEAEQVTADRVRQSLLHVSNDDKLKVLVGLLRHHDPFRTLVFVNTKRGAEMVETSLCANGFEARTISGDVPQNKRLRLLEAFKDGKLPILVATDVAARGLHIPAVSHVINFDLPQDAEDYVHRIGRTARAGEEGDAISLCCETYVYSLPDIEKYVGRRLETEHFPSEWMPEDFVVSRLPSRRPKGGSTRRGGGGGSGGNRRNNSGRPRR